MKFRHVQHWLLFPFPFLLYWFIQDMAHITSTGHPKSNKFEATNSLYSTCDYNRPGYGKVFTAIEFGHLLSKNLKTHSTRLIEKDMDIHVICVTIHEY